MSSRLEFSRWEERAPLPLPRAGCAAGVLDGRFVIAGGTYWQDGRKIWCDRVDGFDPAANGWAALPPMPRPHGDAASAVCRGALYVLGGGGEESTVSSAWSFQDNSWNPLPSMALPAARRSAAAAVLEGQIYLFGGLAGGWKDFSSATSTAWVIEPGGSWRILAPMPGPARFGAAVAAVGRRILVAGGCTFGSGAVQNLDEVLSYDPDANRWSSVGRLPAPSRAASGVADEDRLLVIGGYGEEFENRIVSFDPRTGQAVDAGRLPRALADARFQRLGRAIIGASGENGIKMRAPWTLQSA